MATTKCQVCGADISVEEEDIVLFKRICCPERDVRLEIFNDFPLRLGRFEHTLGPKPAKEGKIRPVSF